MEFEKLKKIIAEVLNIDESTIELNSAFVDDLGADSLDLFEIITGIEEEFELEIPQEVAENIHTVNDPVTDSLMKDNEAINHYELLSLIFYNPNRNTFLKLRRILRSLRNSFVRLKSSELHSNRSSTAESCLALRKC